MCPDCQGRHYVFNRHGAFASARICACARPCPRCGDVGYVSERRDGTFSEKVGARAYEVMVPCDCRRRVERVAGFNAAQLPASLATASFEAYRPAVLSQDQAKKVARNFAFGYRSGAPGRGFILGGPVGTGKTHLLCSALSHLMLESGVRAQYVEISLLYAKIRRGFQDGKSGGEIIGPLSEVEVLAIDEIGKGRGSPFEMETLDELIARRYNAGRTTLFATNYSLAPERRAPPSVRSAPAGYRSSAEHKEAAKDSELLRERVGERIYSRLCEMCEFVELTDAPDHRRTRHEVR